MNLPGTAVALRGGVPVAVFERQGKVLRIFEDTNLKDVFNTFVHDFMHKRLFPTLNRVTVKEYPIEAAEALIAAGFIREIQDYVLYRGYQ